MKLPGINISVGGAEYFRHFSKDGNKVVKIDVSSTCKQKTCTTTNSIKIGGDIAEQLKLFCKKTIMWLKESEKRRLLAKSDDIHKKSGLRNLDSWKTVG